MAAETNTGPFLGQRHVQTFLLFLSIVVNYMAKFNVGVAVVAMTNAESTNPNFPEYDWDEMERSYIISSFFWGYIMTQFLGGWLCRRFGARWTMFVSTIGSALLVLLVPFLVEWGGWQVYCGIRVGMGIFQGLMFPCVHAHLANWCPVSERNRLGALANTGLDCGTLLAMFVSGQVAASSMGWPGIFYISCGVGVLWCIGWMIFGADTPRQSKFISEAELNYIESSINANSKQKEEQAKESNQIPVPWKAILTSLPFWALFLVRCTQSWGYSTLQAEIPAYMNGVLLMDMKSNALYSALPYFASWLMAFVYILIADVLLTRGTLTITGIRKSFSSVASWLPAISLVGLSFLDSNQKTLAIVLMTASVGINAGATIGSALNTIDLSPNHAGILMGIVNTGANVVPILTPLLVGLVVKNDHDRVEWQVVFIISAVIFFLGNLFYIIFGRMVNQPWNAADFLDNQQAENSQEAGQARRASAKAIEARRNSSDSF
ncbi:putative inorganic phosphate cotransporter [Drosophila busckii]|uniref:putative inorganic phosphate cotransporter n=1 Tax=Drosophila busckii TaxID=30019 RepID=UPI00083EE957|nr:putative inorganic phosphate cotransporter [Drosophila busckii]